MARAHTREVAIYSVAESLFHSFSLFFLYMKVDPGDAEYRLGV